MPQTDGQVDASSQPKPTGSSFYVDDPSAFEDEDCFLIGVIMKRRLARWDEANELGNALATEILADH